VTIRSKPPLGRRLNLANPLARGLVDVRLFADTNNQAPVDATGLGGASSPGSGSLLWSAGGIDTLNGAGVSIANAAATNVETVTVAALVAQTFPTLGSDRAIIERWTGEPTYPYVLRASSSTGYPYFAAYDGSNNPKAVTSVAISDGLPHLIVGVRRKNVDLATYVDGALAATAADTTTADTRNTSSLGIGVRGTNGVQFTGLIFFTAVWNRALSQREVSQFAADPYQIFVRRPLLYKVASSGIAITSGTAGEGQGASGTATESIATSGTAGEGEAGFGTVAESIAASGSAGEGEGGTGALGESEAATGTAGEAEGASGSATEKIGATGTAGEGEAATGSATEAVAVAGGAGEGESATGAAGERIDATGTAGEAEYATGFTGNPPLTVTGTAGQDESASGVATESIAATGAAGEGEQAGGALGLSEAATGSAAEGESASGTLAESIAATGAAGEAEAASGTLTLTQPGAFAVYTVRTTVLPAFAVRSALIPAFQTRATLVPAIRTITTLIPTPIPS